METSSWMMSMNYEWSFLGDMSSSFVDNFEVDLGSNWAYPCSFFTCYYVAGVRQTFGSALALSLLDIMWWWKASIPHC